MICNVCGGRGPALLTWRYSASELYRVSLPTCWILPSPQSKYTFKKKMIRWGKFNLFWSITNLLSSMVHHLTKILRTTGRNQAKRLFWIKAKATQGVTRASSVKGDSLCVLKEWPFSEECLYFHHIATLREQYLLKTGSGSAAPSVVLFCIHTQSIKQLLILRGSQWCEGTIKVDHKKITAVLFSCLKYNTHPIWTCPKEVNIMCTTEFPSSQATIKNGLNVSFTNVCVPALQLSPPRGYKLFPGI